MELHGICAAEGTVIGYHEKEKRFLTVDSHDFTTPATTMHLRYATSEELTAIGTCEPRSVVEHLAIPQRMTPFGLARIFGPRPYVKPKVVTKREAKRFVSEFQKRYPGVVSGDNGR